MKDALGYVELITRDDRERIVSETPTIYEEHLIERLYIFDDGAVVKYEWQDLSLKTFNHRFTLVELPSPNPGKLNRTIIMTLNY